MIETVHLFPKLDELLIALLRDLDPADWQKETLAPKWKVKDIAAHLLDGSIRTLSISRDGHSLKPSMAITDHHSLVRFLDDLNADWVKACERMSPPVLISLLEKTSAEYCAHLASLDMQGKAIFAVSWAGEEESKNWFHIAREYTEKMHHQLQIREATNRPMPPTPELFYPFLDTLMQALPWHYRDVNAPEGTLIKFIITSDIGGEWNLQRAPIGWRLVTQGLKEADSIITIDPNTAWKMMTKGMSADNSKKMAQHSGEERYATHFFGMLSIVG